ncbi:hypothetical protein SAMN02800691_2660 [Luteibacter sp. UNCMF366Tsu5.1]|nr:hypothetical protein SAMN02800691_2660 [Luteibacter sp. UNCMF366Tsu5.1]
MAARGRWLLAAIAAPTGVRHCCGSRHGGEVGSPVGAILMAKNQRSGVAVRLIPIATRVAPTTTRKNAPIARGVSVKP